MSGRHCTALRRLLLALLGSVAVSFAMLPSAAGDAVVPLRTQAQLVVKLAGYDRNLSARLGPRQVLIVRAKSTASQRVAEGIAAELRTFDAIAGAPHRENILEYTTAQDLRTRVSAQAVQILYVCPGLEEQVAGIASALTGLTVLSIGAGPEYANLGTVIAFDIHSGRSQLLVNLKQAQKQNVKFYAEFLKIVKVIR
jgi:YfiR/HmsC-like